MGYQQSCRLALIIDGRLLVNEVSVGPVVCQEGNLLQCYQPAEEACLTITLARGLTSLSLKPATLPTANLASAYEQSITATGGTPPYLYAMTLGDLPPGLILDSTTGIISGNATVDGTYTFNLGVTDNQGQRAEQRYTLLVDGFIPCKKTITSSLTTTNPYSQTLTLHYLMAGGGGGSGGDSTYENGAGGSGGSSAILVDGTLAMFASGGDGGANTTNISTPGSPGLRIDVAQVLSLPIQSTLSAILGGGGGGGGGGGFGKSGGGGGASNGGGYFGSGSDMGGSVGGNGSAGISNSGGNGGNSAVGVDAIGGTGGASGAGGVGGVGGTDGTVNNGSGNLGGGGGGSGGSSGSNGYEGGAGGGQGSGGLGASTLTLPSVMILSPEAGMGGQQQGKVAMVASLLSNMTHRQQTVCCNHETSMAI